MRPPVGKWQRRGNVVGRPTISVITPTHNSGERLIAVVDAVARQTYGALEHIVVDDGSTDQTPETLRRLAAEHRSLVAMTQPNRGRSTARNAGLARAHGDYVMFLDDDDTLSDHCLSEMARRADDAAGAVVNCNWTEDYRSGLSSTVSAHLGGETVFEVTAKRCPFAIHSCLVPRVAALASGGFDDDLSFAEDWDFWQRLARAGIEFVHLDSVLVGYTLSHRPVNSRTAGKQYRQAATVIQRAFTADQRVGDPVERYHHGLLGGSDRHGLLVLWAWFAGIECAQATDFTWLSDALTEIGTDDLAAVPSGYDLATSFGSGLNLGRGAAEAISSLTGSSLHRLAELACAYGIDDPSAMVYRRTMPPRLPAAVADNLHLQIGIGRRTVTAGPDAGRLHCWKGIAGAARQMPEAVYLLDPGSALTVNPILGVARQVARVLGKPANWLALPALLRAAVRDRRLARQLGRRFISAALDQSIEGSRIHRLDPSNRQRSAIAPGASSTFERIFEQEDPWTYDRPYETRKYDETLELICSLETTRPIEAVEIGCAEGHFTSLLAGVTRSVLAVDVSRTALERLEQRMKRLEITNVHAEYFDLTRDRLGERFDLIVCSEVLYYIPEAELAMVVDRLVDSLRPGGHLVHAHAYEASERAGRPGFGWRQPFGAAAISAALSDHPELRREATIESDLYVVERFGRNRSGSAPSHDIRPIDRSGLEPEIADQVLWSGYGTTPRDALKLETRELPVFAYHLVGEDVPEALRPYNIETEQFAAQLEWLRWNGYRSAAPSEIRSLAETGCPLPGKAVAITFDDAYESFATRAWPMLQAYGFGAVLFVPTGHLGGVAEWDDRHGPPNRLLTAPDIRELASLGVVIGSHFREHRPLANLATDQLIEGFQASRRTLEDLTGNDVRLVAYPFGQSDPVIERLAGYCGYQLGFTTANTAVKPFDNRLSMGRFLIDGTSDPIQQMTRRLPATHTARRLRLQRTVQRVAAAAVGRIETLSR